ncbi:MAG: insulinase family protein [Acidobacteriota bacterium]|nr:MAG: insulinase family protein [Acidobacteriota bacterium]
MRLRLRKWGILGLLVLLATASFLPAQRRGGRIVLPEYYRAFRAHEMDERFSRVVFRNGLTVIVEEHPSLPLAVVSLTVKVGSLDSDGRTKAAVLAEFLRTRLVRGIDELGGRLAVSVHEFSTQFTVTVPEDNALEALEELEKVFLRKDWDEEQLEFSQRWISEKTQRWEKSSWRQRVDPLIDAVFGGSAQILESAQDSTESFREFHRLYYHTNNAIVTVTGAVRREQVLRKLVDLVGESEPPFDGKQGGYWADRQASVEGFHYGQRTFREPVPLVLLGFPYPEARSSDYWKGEIVSYLLGEGQAALLRLEAGEEPEPRAFEVKVWQEVRERGTCLVIGFAPEPGALDRAETRVLGTLRALAASPLPVSVLNRAKALRVADFYHSMEDLAKRAEQLAHFEALGDFRARDRVPESIAEITPAEVQAFARKFLNRERLSVIEWLPAGGEARTFDQESFRETVDILAPEGTRQAVGLLANLDEEGVGRFKPQTITPLFSRSDLKRSSVLRGPEIYLREQHTDPLVHLGFFFPGGRVSETPQNTGMTELVLRAVLAAQARREGGLLINRFEQMGSRVEIVNRPDFFGYRVTMLSRELNEAFLNMVMFLREATFEEADLESARKAMLKQRLLDVDWDRDRPVRWVARQLFGEHPYAFNWKDRVELVSQIKLEDAKSWLDQNIRGVHPYIVVSGDVAGTSFLQAFISRLSDPRLEVREAVRNEVKFAENEAGQSGLAQLELDGEVAIAFPGPEEGTYLLEMVDLAERLIAGEGGILYRLLRETEK